MRHNSWITGGRPWGSFVEVRQNAAESYLAGYQRERRWGRRSRGRFGVFMSSSTEPFMPQERRFRVTRSVLEAMLSRPPDLLVLQTHSHRVTEYIELYRELAERCELRIHLSIETDRDRLARAAAARQPGGSASGGGAGAQDRWPLYGRHRRAAPPHRRPRRLLRRDRPLGRRGDDRSLHRGRRHRRRQPHAPHAAAVIEEVLPGASELSYRDAMVAVAQRRLPGRVGVNVDGFAGRYL